MATNLHYQTVTPLLRSVLTQLMAIPEFEPFRLVGGTSLSLRLGHRVSDDIDLFTDAEYSSLDFYRLQDILRSTFPYCYGDCGEIVSFGSSYIIGNSKDDAVKLDLFYTDEFIKPLSTVDNIRLASIDDIVAMKVDVVGRGGRKKDFWDLHELHNWYSIEQMLALHEQRYPYNHNAEEITRGFTMFDAADAEPDPNCFHGKVWQLIKLDFAEWLDDFEH